VKVGDLVKRSPITVNERSSIREAAKVMSSNRIGLLVVTDSRGEIKGVVSERDIVKAVARGEDLDLSVMRIATKNVISLERDAGIEEAAYLMSENRIRHLVITEKGKLYGVISVRDIVEDERFIKAIANFFQSIDKNA